MSRPPVTPAFVMDIFKNLDPSMMLLLMGFLVQPEETADKGFQDFLADLAQAPYSPGKLPAIEGIRSLYTGWKKMTLAEQEWLRLKLRDPRFVTKYLSPEQIAEGAMTLLPKESLMELARHIEEQYPGSIMEAYQEAHAPPLKDLGKQKDFDFLFKADWEKCNVKFKGPKDRDYRNFGMIFADDRTKIYLRSIQTGRLTSETQEWNSIAEMLNAGWMVD